MYRNKEAAIKNQVEADNSINEYLKLKKSQASIVARLDELQEHIKAYMDTEGLTRVFGNDGYISKKTQQRHEYDFEKVKELLSPFGKWDSILSADAAKLKQILYEVPESTRLAIEEARAITKEYEVITASLKKIKEPDDVAEEETARS